jgi:hypothetical protein
MNHPDRNARRGARLGGLALAAALVLMAMPAEARLTDPGYGGGLSGGYFHGLPVRATAPSARPSDPEISGVAGANCRVLRQAVQDRIGGTVLRTVEVCD